MPNQELSDCEHLDADWRRPEQFRRKKYAGRHYLPRLSQLRRHQHEVELTRAARTQRGIPTEAHQNYSHNTTGVWSRSFTTPQPHPYVHLVTLACGFRVILQCSIEPRQSWRAHFFLFHGEWWV